MPFIQNKPRKYLSTLKSANVKRRGDTILFDAAVLRKEIPFDEFVLSTSDCLKGGAIFWLIALVNRTRCTIEIQSDVSSRDGVGVVIKSGEEEILEIFRDDSDRTRYVTIYSNELPLVTLKEAIRVFTTEYYHYITYEEKEGNVFKYSVDFAGMTAWKTPLIEYYREFKSVYVILNSFYKPTKPYDLNNVKHNRFAGGKFDQSYPTEEYIIDSCETVTWKYILDNSTLKTFAEIDTALIGMQVDDAETTRLQNELAKFCDQTGLFYPLEQAICPKVVYRMRNALLYTNHRSIKLKDQFNETSVEISGELKYPHLFRPFAIDADSLTTLRSSTFDDCKVIVCSKLDSHAMQNAMKKYNIEFIMPRPDSSLQDLSL
ncbi:DUF2711 family protein [Neolewinella maritima]|uniref:DUF2711 family protein n=1 Tax=Neolewinella maritima TaxID=1383882 RepID=UPI001EE7F29C|nr:DUF2711 family protein [Neolewinella maritima]